MSGDAKKLDLTGAKVLMVGNPGAEQDVLSQTLMGFGVACIQRRHSVDDAIAMLESDVFDLTFIEASLKGGDGFELVSLIRLHKNKNVCHIPVVIVHGHVRKKDVFKARDCGAHFVLTKPYSPKICFDRIYRLTKDARPFIYCDAYVGPDRRFHSIGLPAGQKGRRHDDLSAEVGQAVEANLSQDDVDGFFGARKVALS